MSEMYVYPDRHAGLLGEPQSLVDGLVVLRKSSSEEENWEFTGVASDTSVDVEGDEILRKALDLTYAAQRGYVNWDHFRQPEDQIGFLRSATLIPEDGVEELQAETGLKLSKSSSVLVRGELYKFVPKAGQVQRILKSTPQGQIGLGLSLDGVMARDVEDGGIIKAFVRGVAVTPVPAHPKTLLQLSKSLLSFSDMPPSSQSQLDTQIEQIASKVVEMLKSAGVIETPAEVVRMTPEDATMWLLKKRPTWSYELASQVVRYTQQRLSEETNHA